MYENLKYIFNSFKFIQFMLKYKCLDKDDHWGIQALKETCLK